MTLDSFFLQILSRSVSDHFLNYMCVPVFQCVLVFLWTKFLELYFFIEQMDGSNLYFGQGEVTDFYLLIEHVI